jgi:hypothetical protein
MGGQRTKNGECGDTSWLALRIFIFELLWEQVMKHDLPALHIRKQMY